MVEPSAPQQASVHILTLGCPKNEADSDRMAASLRAAGHAMTDDLDRADVAIVNTCAFIRDATAESLDTVLALAGQWKDGHPRRKLVVAGCLASRYGADLPGELPEVDAFMAVADEDTVAEVMSGLLGGQAVSGGLTQGAPSAARIARVASPVLRTTGASSSYVTIADGCSHVCSYCTIPMIRGPYCSRPADDILAEAHMLAAGGAREIILVGQDTTSYGRDLPAGAAETDLPSLVRALSLIEELSWLRLMYVQPDGVTTELLETMAASRAICRYLDLPLQHASGRVLRAMRRTGDATAFLDLVSRVRSLMPDVMLRTTLIAGFPGETDDDVDEVLDFLRAARFDYVGVFAFSPEEGTAAAGLPGQVPEAERKARAQLFMDTAEEIGTARVAAHVGEVVEVLVEGRDPDGVGGQTDGPAFVGRWRGQAPEIDGGVYLDADVEPGVITTVELVDSLGYDLMGAVR